MTKLTLTNHTFQAKENHFIQTTTQVLNWMQMNSASVDNEDESDNDLTENDRNTSLFGLRNCFEWKSKALNCATQAIRHNIIKVRLAKLEGPARSLGDSPFAEQVRWLLLSNNMIEEIVQRTNYKLASMQTKIENPDSCYQDTDFEEISVLIGLLLLYSIFKSSRESLRSSFSTSITGRSIFRAIMIESREETNAVTAVSHIFNILIENCQNKYAMGGHGCVDEILVPLRGRVRFVVYMPKKPTKYGIKLLCLTEAYNSQLLKHGLAFGATMKANRPQISPEFLPNKTRAVGSSLYGFTKELTLLSHVPE
ncbi:hypothetical protein PR048_011053 [Dryococelus australis]|uniref:PiggyBac transposable element-derived protein domain-containing protein n=1 Tax=Dryococelus australis TaxID=614101 RepID=A0ABQ9HKT7_9NEOP|nr:hypothetical protein PR048_011053 [Dryococelus australis]